ncbi:hypothetical protein EMIT0P12_110103 [Pseudomonas sp. IT-P12]
MRRRIKAISDQADLVGFRKVAKTYEALTEQQIQYLLDKKEFLEISHD